MAEEAKPMEIYIDRKVRRIGGLGPEVADRCFTCGTCSGGCPATGLVPMEGTEGTWDIRKVVRAIVFGMEQEVIDSKFPWVCTMCGRCQYACPMGIDLLRTLWACRALRDRDKVPTPMHQGTVMCLEKGNNLGIPKDDFLFLLADLGKELEDECCPGFYVPVDKEGANVIITINSKEPFGEPDDMKFWWKIFYAAREDWTVPSENWEGVNWGLFSCNEEAMKEIVHHIIENARRLKVKTILYPE
ncbi:MAG: 4Fe-4S dicluster domain-containing protein [Deltaproteobacteria bacterium]|nr:4Fe-4S dicluster domain-containing protein [Deltaproteobacteria bacterium]